LIPASTRIPILTKPTNRIVAYKSIFSTDGDQTSLETNDVASWHGMMTSVVAAGNGELAGGFYRGIASDAKLALVKISRTGRITKAIFKKKKVSSGSSHTRMNSKFAWRTSRNAAISEGVTCELSSRRRSSAARWPVDRICAVGNAGHVPGHPVLRPRALLHRSLSAGSTIRTRRSRAPGNVSLVIWANYRRPAKTGSHRARHLGRRAYSAKTPTAKRPNCILIASLPDDELRSVIELHEVSIRIWTRRRRFP